MTDLFKRTGSNFVVGDPLKDPKEERGTAVFDSGSTITEGYSERRRGRLHEGSLLDIGARRTAK